MAQVPSVEETIEVRVVNVDVHVSDDSGRPILGLGPEDFALTVDGRPRRIDYFSAYHGGWSPAAASGEVEGGAEAAPLAPAERPYVAIAWDGRDLEPGENRRVIDSLRGRLDRLLESAEAVMVVSQRRRMRIEQPFTRDRELLEATLERLAKPPPPSPDRTARRFLMREIERSETAEAALPGYESLRVEERAQTLLQQIRAERDVERHGTEVAAAGLRELVRTLAGLPGRKAVLYLGRGFRARPGEAMFRMWWSKFRSIAPGFGIYSIESEIGLELTPTQLLEVVTEANDRRIAFYTYDPVGARIDGSSVQFASVEATQFTDREAADRQESLMLLAHGTGGLGRIRGGGLESLIDDMAAGFGSYYSLGFEVEGESGRGRVRVEVGDGAYRLRYLDRFGALPATRGLDEEALATLLTDLGANPLEVGVEVGPAERLPDGEFEVPLLLKTPIARLALLPRENAHVGRLTVVVIAQNGEGELSKPAWGEVAIEIDNGELLESLSRLAGYRLRLRISEGEQKIAIGVRDEVARSDSTLNLVVRPDWGP